MKKVLGFLGLTTALAAAAPYVTFTVWPALLTSGTTVTQGWLDAWALFEHIYSRSPQRFSELRTVSAMAVATETAAVFALVTLGGLLGWFFSVVRVPWWLFTIVGLALLPFACTFRPFAGLPADPVTQLRPVVLLALASLGTGLLAALGLRKL